MIVEKRNGRLRESVVLPVFYGFLSLPDLSWIDVYYSSLIIVFGIKSSSIFSLISLNKQVKAEQSCRSV